MVRHNDSKVGMRQEQYVNIASAEHGMTDEVRCAFVDYAEPAVPPEIRAGMMREKYVKVLFYRGAVKRVFCHHFDEGKCGSRLNKGDNARCMILPDAAGAMERLLADGG